MAITVAGTYTVTVPTASATPYYYANSLTLGTGATGTQKLAVNAYMIINKAFHVGVGDSIDIGAGRFNARHRRPSDDVASAAHERCVLLGVSHRSTVFLRPGDSSDTAARR